MDQQVPQLMGVSKAILENGSRTAKTALQDVLRVVVVFCHQEESNWPLGDMAKLKKKFDDLFGATR